MPTQKLVALFKNNPVTRPKCPSTDEWNKMWQFHTKERVSATTRNAVDSCCNLGEPWTSYAVKEANPEGHIVCDPTDMKRPEQVHWWRHTVPWWGPWLAEKRMGSDWEQTQEEGILFGTMRYSKISSDGYTTLHTLTSLNCIFWKGKFCGLWIIYQF